MAGNVLEALVRTPIGHQAEHFPTEIACECLQFLLFDFRFVERFDVMALFGVTNVLVLGFEFNLAIVTDVDVNWFRQPKAICFGWMMLLVRRIIFDN